MVTPYELIGFGVCCVVLNGIIVGLILTVSDKWNC